MVNRIIDDVNFNDGDDDEYEGKYNDDDILSMNEEKASLLIASYDLAFHMLKYARPLVRVIVPFDDEILSEMQDTLDKFMYITAMENEEGVSYWDESKSTVDKRMAIAAPKLIEMFLKLRELDLDLDQEGDE